MGENDLPKTLQVAIRGEAIVKVAPHVTVAPNANIAMHAAKSNIGRMEEEQPSNPDVVNVT